jgi:hypothetical protein
MKTRRMVFPVMLGLIFIVLPIALGACSSLLPASSGSNLDVQSQVNTQVAATLVGYLVQTKVADNLTANQVTQAAAVQQAATATPAPTETPLPPPTATPIPPTVPPPPPTPEPTQAPAAAAVVSAPAPQISADVNTNCRQGPSTRYIIDGYLMVGASSYVYGRDSASQWWYIQNPTDKSAYCWVWSESTSVSGDARGVPVVAVAEDAQTTYSNLFASQNYGYYGYNGAYNGSWCQPYYQGGKVYCYPTPFNCDPNNWLNCGYWPSNCNNNKNNCNCNNNWPNNCNNNKSNCNCNNNWPNNCGKPQSCQIPEGSNYWNYCFKHPKCCGWK